MRLIDADVMIKELKEMKVEGECFTTAVNFAIIEIENAPTVDTDSCEGCPYCPPNNGIPIGVE